MTRKEAEDLGCTHGFGIGRACPYCVAERMTRDEKMTMTKEQAIIRLKHLRDEMHQVYTWACEHGRADMQRAALIDLACYETLLREVEGTKQSGPPGSA